MNTISVIRKQEAVYPNKQDLFRPDTIYPEYIFKTDISDEQNQVYAMVREGFHMLGLDAENYGTMEWNPLQNYVQPGDNILIKPNMVLHFNACGGGTECLYTNPSLVAAVIDYVLIALKGKGKITVGDAPLQECIFETLVQDSGYDVLIDYYRKKGIDISLIDFRNVKTQERDGLHYLQEGKKNKGVIVRLDEDSAFADVSEERLRKLRITNYDPRILQEHHHNRVHEYKVAEEVLNADVIINMPKPKTHRKAGVTISLKNLVGINANKEFLPHHTVGSRDEGGDAYLKLNKYLELANSVLDIRNMLVNEGEMELAGYAERLYEKLREKKADEKYWEGSWYGNDTIWRTILDLNIILYYADKNGKMCSNRQRKMFIVGDMIVSGEKEGPLEPTATYPKTIVMGDDPVLFDMAVCSLMGFDYKDIPSINMPGMENKKNLISAGGIPKIVSNCHEWNDNPLENIRENYSLRFEPSFGWIEKLGSWHLKDIVSEIKRKGNRVYVFGAGELGIFIAEKLLNEDVQIVSFCDNNETKQNKAVLKDIMCIKPADMDKSIPVLIAVKIKFLKEIEEQIFKLGGMVIGSV